MVPSSRRGWPGRRWPSAVVRGLVALTGMAASPWAATAEPAVPLTTLFARPQIGAVSLSPRGRWLAATVPGRNEGRLELVVADLSRSPLSFRTLAWLKDYDVAQVFWLTEQRLVFTAFDSQAGAWSGETGLWAADLDGGDNRMLIDPYWAGFRAVQPGNRQILSAEWVYHDRPMDGSNDVFVLRRGWSSLRSQPTYTLHRLDTRDPRPRQLDKDAPEGTFDWLLDEEGRPRWLQARLGRERRVYRLVGEGQWQEAGRFDILSSEGWSPRLLLGGALLVSGEPRGAQGSQLLRWDDERGGPSGEPVLRAQGFDVGDSAWPLIDAGRRQPLGWRYRLDARYTRWTDPDMAAAQAAVDRALPGRINEIRCSHCLDAERWLVVSRSDRRPPEYAVLDRANGRLTPLGSAHPEWPEAGLGARSFHRTRSRDDRDLPLYLTRPVADLADPAAKPRPRAAVVYVHGGPASRVALEASDPVPQFLASRGYVVVEPEFRGSAGYGASHQLAGAGQWGTAMQDDLQDALGWAVRQGWVDPQRVCIMGASYGGYAALMGPVRHPESYRCAIAWLAPTDLPRLVDEAADEWPMDRSPRTYISQQVGNDAAARSPLTQVARIKVPVLAAWGVEDRRVPIGHGRDFRSAARAAGVELEYVEYPGEGHGWALPATDLDFFGRAERLLARALQAP